MGGKMVMFKNIQGAIFDMDGTLVDSMWLWEDIDKKYLNKKNISFTVELKNTLQNMTLDEAARYLKNSFNLTESIPEIQKEWYNMLLDEYSNNISLAPGFKEI